MAAAPTMQKMHLLDVQPIVELAHHMAKLQWSWQVIDHILRGEIAVVLVVQRLGDEVSGQQPAMFVSRRGGAVES